MVFAVNNDVLVVGVSLGKVWVGLFRQAVFLNLSKLRLFILIRLDEANGTSFTNKGRGSQRRVKGQAHFCIS